MIQLLQNLFNGHNQTGPASQAGLAVQQEGTPATPFNLPNEVGVAMGGAESEGMVSDDQSLTQGQAHSQQAVTDTRGEPLSAESEEITNDKFAATDNVPNAAADEAIPEDTPVVVQRALAWMLGRTQGVQLAPAGEGEAESAPEALHRTEGLGMSERVQRIVAKQGEIVDPYARIGKEPSTEHPATVQQQKHVTELGKLIQHTAHEQVGEHTQRQGSVMSADKAQPKVSTQNNLGAQVSTAVSENVEARVKQAAPTKDTAAKPLLQSAVVSPGQQPPLVAGGKPVEGVNAVPVQEHSGAVQVPQDVQSHVATTPRAQREYPVRGALQEQPGASQEQSNTAVKVHLYDRSQQPGAKSQDNKTEPILAKPDTAKLKSASRALTTASKDALSEQAPITPVAKQLPVVKPQHESQKPNSARMLKPGITEPEPKPVGQAPAAVPAQPMAAVDMNPAKPSALLTAPLKVNADAKGDVAHDTAQSLPGKQDTSSRAQGVTDQVRPVIAVNTQEPVVIQDRSRQTMQAERTVVQAQSLGEMKPSEAWSDKAKVEMKADAAKAKIAPALTHGKLTQAGAEDEMSQAEEHSTRKPHFDRYARRAREGEPIAQAQSAELQQRTPSGMSEKINHNILNVAREGVVHQPNTVGTADAIPNSKMNELKTETVLPPVNLKAGMQQTREWGAPTGATPTGSATAEYRAGTSSSGEGGYSKGQTPEHQHNQSQQHHQAHQAMRGLSAVSPATHMQQAFTEPSAYTSLQADVIPALLQQIDRFRKMNKHNVRMKLELPGGERLTLQLRLDSDRVKVRFQTESEEMRDFLNDGWAGLANQASKRGINLASPEFLQDLENDAADTKTITEEQLKRLYNIMDVGNILKSNPELDVSNPTRSNTPTLDAEDYFELLVTQLVNQDPLEPMKDTDFVAQMSTFTSLEQMKQLNEGFAAYTNEQMEIAAQNYLGKEVSLNHASGILVDGIVSAVSTVRDAAGEANVALTVDGKQYSISDVREVRLPTEEAS